jgi:hypothetical protein
VLEHLPGGEEAERAARALAVISAVRTLARSDSGVRAVRTATIGPLTSGTNRLATNSAAATTGHGGRSGSIQSGSANARIPSSAPAPNAAWKTPAIHELPPNSSKA